MNTFTDIEELNKELRNVLIEQSNLPAERVLNSLSVYGTDLDKLFKDTSTYVSIEQADVMLLFELRSDDANSNVSMDTKDAITTKAIVCSNEIRVDGQTVSDDTTIVDDTHITYYKTFRLHIILYGDESTNVATKLIGRLRTNYVKTSLFEKGILLDTVTNSEINNEFINNTMWLRNDFNIKLGIKYDIKKVADYDDYEHLSELNIKNN